MGLYDKVIAHEEKLSLVGLGYVGMPIAVAFAKKGVDVIGSDLNKEKIKLYKSGIDPTKEVGDYAIKASTVDFTADESRLREAKFHIVAVPTPVNTDHTRIYRLLSARPKFSAGILPRVQSLCMNQRFIRAAPRMCASPFLNANPGLSAARILK